MDMLDKFPLTSEQCQLLIALESGDSISEVAIKLARDTSVISRQLNKLAAVAPVVEKRNGRWQLTPIGLEFVIWSKQAVLDQNRMLQSQKRLRIATTREFAARVLSPALAKLFPPEDKVLVSVMAMTKGVEQVLLDGEADIGLDCGRPMDPAVRFKRVIAEPFSIVATKEFINRYEIENLERLLKSPYLLYDRISVESYLKLEVNLKAPAAVFNDIAAQRAAVLASMGWAVVPKYAVQQELDSGSLISLPYKEIPSEQFGIWYLFSRKGLKEWALKLTDWLNTLEL